MSSIRLLLSLAGLLPVVWSDGGTLDEGIVSVNEPGATLGANGASAASAGIAPPPGAVPVAALKTTVSGAAVGPNVPAIDIAASALESGFVSGSVRPTIAVTSVIDGVPRFEYGKIASLSCSVSVCCI